MSYSGSIRKLKKSLRRRQKQSWLHFASWLISCSICLLSAATSLAAPADETIAECMKDELQQSLSRCHVAMFFGIDDQGRLSLFDGIPEKKKVLRTFFQLDIEYLESRLPREHVEQLYNGIRVKDKEEYDSVLSTYCGFALERER